MNTNDMVNIRKIIMSIPITHADEEAFKILSKDWKSFCGELVKLDREHVMKLIKYLMLNSNNVSYLNRSISRFNKLNALSVEVLCWKKK